MERFDLISIEQRMAAPAAVILCGGAGSRLGGVDKPLRMLAGRSLIERVVHRVGPHVDGIVISANRNFDLYAEYAGCLVADREFGSCGPLAGLLAGMEAASKEDILCVPGDAPLLPQDLVARLKNARRRAVAPAAYAHDGTGPQPLCCLVQRESRDSLRTYMKAGGRTPWEWLQRLGAVAEEFNDVPRWAWSLNTEREWLRAGRLLERATA